jgi:hypothetical protein
MKTTTNNNVKVSISREAIINALNEMKKEERESFLEDLLAMTSPKYLESIREARSDCKNGRLKPHSAVFSHKTK